MKILKQEYPEPRNCSNCKHNDTLKKCFKCRTYEKNSVIHYHTKFKAKKPELPSWDEICNSVRDTLNEASRICKELDDIRRE